MDEFVSFNEELDALLWEVIDNVSGADVLFWLVATVIQVCTFALVWKVPPSAIVSVCSCIHVFKEKEWNWEQLVWHSLSTPGVVAMPVMMVVSAVMLFAVAYRTKLFDDVYRAGVLTCQPLMLQLLMVAYPVIIL